MMRWGVLLVVGMVMLPALACDEDPQVSTPPEVFTGKVVMTPDFESGNVDHAFPDSTEVTFTVEGALYELVMEGETDFRTCDSRGTVRNFGTNTVTLTPTGVMGASCDSIRIPRGEFPTVFRGDSLYIGPTDVAYEITINNRTVTDVMTWHFRLVQVQ